MRYPLKPMQKQKNRISSRTVAFSLVELLVVMAIIGILLAVAAPLIPSLLRGNQVDSGINTLSGILEEARETATSGNTYVWVAFTDAPLNSPVGTWVAVIQSQDGTETGINSTVTPSWAASIAVPGNTSTPGTANLQLHSKIQNLPGIQIVDANKLAATLISQAPASTAATTLYENGQTWNITTLQNPSLNTASGVSNFNHAIEFTPNGEAHVPIWDSNIQFGLVPTLGSSTNSALFNISRLTGKTTVYRQ
jgi:prepilin-type N-terminal cleavage/methylation domain-containing protein